MSAQREALPGEINGDAFDRFTLAHLGWGAALGALGLSFPLTVAIGVAWEFVEDPLKDQFSGLFPNATHDSTENAVVDVLAVMLGWQLHRRVNG